MRPVDNCTLYICWGMITHQKVLIDRIGISIEVKKSGTPMTEKGVSDKPLRNAKRQLGERCPGLGIAFVVAEPCRAKQSCKVPSRAKLS